MPKPAAPEACEGHFTLSPNDQAQLTLVFLEKTKAGVTLRPRYRGLACDACGGFDPHAAFELGFDDVKIRVKGDFGFADDKILLVSRRMLDVLEQERVAGFEAEPIGGDGWHAIRVTRAVQADPAVRKRSGDPCPECGRPKEIFGLYARLAQLTPPPERATFLTPTHPRIKTAAGYRLEDRDVFVTGDVVTALKRHGIKGGACRRLMTEDEWRQLLEDNAKHRTSKLPAAVLLR